MVVGQKYSVPKSPIGKGKNRPKPVVPKGVLFDPQPCQHPFTELIPLAVAPDWSCCSQWSARSQWLRDEHLKQHSLAKRRSSSKYFSSEPSFPRSDIKWKENKSLFQASVSKPSVCTFLRKSHGWWNGFVPLSTLIASVCLLNNT